MLKFSIDFVKNKVLAEGFELVPETYNNSKSKIEYICKKCGFHNKVVWNQWDNKKDKCKQCSKNDRTSLLINKIKPDIEKEGYKIESVKIVNGKSVLNLICKNKHSYKTTLSNWYSSNHRCGFCVGYTNYDEVKKDFDSKGYILLSKTYNNSKETLYYLCPNGHKGHTTYYRWLHLGASCFVCAEKERKEQLYKKAKDSFKQSGYTLLSEEYVAIEEPLNFICNKGHNSTISYKSWFSGHRCRVCAGVEKKTYIEVKDYIEENGHTLLSDSYERCKDKLTIQCTKEHVYTVSWDHFSSKGSRCPICSKLVSKKEEELFNFLQSNSIKVEGRNRSIIKPYELDIVIPDKKIAMEYCGLYWHSELTGKDKNYHLNKLKMCQENGLTLVTVFEDEYLNNKEIVLSRLNNLLGINKNKIYARKCIIKEISTEGAKQFCEENHLQGYTGSSIKLGAFYKDELVSVMTFSKPSISKGSIERKQGVWELSRFCSKLNTSVVGGASKLLSYFKKNYEWVSIFSYADRRWSDGNLYEKVGFSFDSVTKPNYWYLDKTYGKRLHRFSLRKNKEDIQDMSEWENRKRQGYNRIWDCGNLKYVINKGR